MKILILANSRYKGGLSGGDAIYESFKKYWPCEFIESNCNIEYSPFFLCYIQRILQSVVGALFDCRSFDIVYSSSDFLPDSLAGFIYRLKGKKWIAGFYLKAFKENPVHYYSQMVVRKLIQWFADMVIVTNPTMYDIFPNKKKTWINGGIDLSLAGLSDKPKVYDAVFCGRIHPSKGIDELLEIWDLVRKDRPKARLAIIGDGDLGKEYIRRRLFMNHGKYNYNGIDLLGYMDDERFDIYKQSKVVLYPTPLKYDHFSMAPVEAMSCGCTMIVFRTPCQEFMKATNMFANGIKDFSELIIARISSTHITYLKHQEEDNFNFSKKFDYEIQSLRVWEDVNANIGNGCAGNGRDFSMPEFKRSRPDSSFKS